MSNTDQIKQLDAGTSFNKSFAGEKIPSLVETIECLSECDLGANIEIKTYPGAEEETAVTALKIIQQHWPEHLAPPLLSSIAHQALVAIREQDKEIFLGLILHSWDKNWQQRADNLNCVSVHVKQRVIKKEYIEEIKNTQRLALSYTVNNPVQAKKLFSWGLDAVFSDSPDKILEII